MANLQIPRFMISAPQSGSGKTTIVCALLKALMDRGFKISAFKSGPDYIDPMFHSRVIGTKSRNLDIFMLGRKTVRYLAAKNSSGSDVAVFEGAMGYYDGIGDSVESSAYDLAKTCDVPVILVVNGRGAALSVAALIKGFKEFKTDSRIEGVILNNIKPSTYLFYKKVLEKEAKVKILGYFPVMNNCSFESRHLGLVTAEEIKDLQEIVDRLARQAEQSIDFDALLKICRSANPLRYSPQAVRKLGDVKIAIAQDKAFCFYYQDALDLLRELGADLVPFSPLKDKHLPECSGIILGGGYPELYARQLSENRTMLSDIRNALKNNLPCFAECGGFMYLLEKHVDNDAKYNWVGAIKGESFMTKSLTRFGYVYLQAERDNVLCRAGEGINGHEFHYSDSTANGSGFIARKKSGGKSWACTNISPTLYAGYPHIHLWGNPEFAKNFVASCCSYEKNARID